MLPWEFSPPIPKQEEGADAAAPPPRMATAHSLIDLTAADDEKEQNVLAGFVPEIAKECLEAFGFNEMDAVKCQELYEEHVQCEACYQVAKADSPSADDRKPTPVQLDWKEASDVDRKRSFDSIESLDPSDGNETGSPAKKSRVQEDFNHVGTSETAGSSCMLSWECQPDELQLGNPNTKGKAEAARKHPNACPVDEQSNGLSTPLVAVANEEALRDAARQLASLEGTIRTSEEKVSTASFPHSQGDVDHELEISPAPGKSGEEISSGEESSEQQSMPTEGANPSASPMSAERKKHGWNKELLKQFTYADLQDLLGRGNDEPLDKNWGSNSWGTNLVRRFKLDRHRRRNLVRRFKQRFQPDSFEVKSFLASKRKARLVSFPSLKPAPISHPSARSDASALAAAATEESDKTVDMPNQRSPVPQNDDPMPGHKTALSSSSPDKNDESQPANQEAPSPGTGGQVADTANQQLADQDSACDDSQTIAEPPETNWLVFAPTAARDGIGKLRQLLNAAQDKDKILGDLAAAVSVCRPVLHPHTPMTERQQQRQLLLLRHAALCQHEEGQCPVSPCCASSKRLQKHLMGCRDKSCFVPHCVSSGCTLNHYHICKDAQCLVCGPVKEAIRRSEKRENWIQAQTQRNEHELQAKERANELFLQALHTLPLPEADGADAQKVDPTTEATLQVEDSKQLATQESASADDEEQPATGETIPAVDLLETAKEDISRSADEEHPATHFGTIRTSECPVDTSAEATRTDDEDITGMIVPVSPEAHEDMATKDYAEDTTARLQEEEINDPSLSGAPAEGVAQGIEGRMMPRQEDADSATEDTVDCLMGSTDASSTGDYCPDATEQVDRPCDDHAMIVDRQPATLECSDSSSGDDGSESATESNSTCSIDLEQEGDATGLRVDAMVSSCPSGKMRQTKSCAKYSAIAMASGIAYGIVQFIFAANNTGGRSNPAFFDTGRY